MPKLSEIKTSTDIKAIFKGEAGTRKSVESFYFPEPMYIFDFDGKTGGVAKKHRPKMDLEFDLYDFHNPKDLITALNRKMEDIQVHPGKYQTVILDSLSALVMKVLAYSMSFNPGGKSIGEIRLPEWDDFNAETNILSTIINFAKQITGNTILIAHVMPDNKGINRRLFTAGRAASSMLPALFNECYHFQQILDDKGNVRYQVRTTNTGIDFARTALNLPEVIDINEGGSLYKKVDEVRRLMDRTNDAVEIK